MRSQGDLDLTYNDNGELTSKTNRTTGESLTLSYTTLGDLKTATSAAGDQIEYLLDGAGRRVGKKVDGQLTQGLIYSPEAYGPVAELDENNALVARFVYGRGSNVPDYMLKGSNTYRIITDQLGSVVMVTDATSGAVAQEITYGPFGEVLSDSNPGFQPFGFAGGIYDQDTGLVHFGAREYDAELGRWTAADPIGFGGGDSNLYGYVLGDPVNLVDPSGLYGLNDLRRDVIGTFNEIPESVSSGASADYLSNYAAGALNALTLGLANRVAGVDGKCAGLGYGFGSAVGTVGSIAYGYGGTTRAIAEVRNARAALPIVRALSPQRIAEIAAQARLGNAVGQAVRDSILQATQALLAWDINDAFPVDDCGC